MEGATSDAPVLRPKKKGSRNVMVSAIQSEIDMGFSRTTTIPQVKQNTKFDCLKHFLDAEMLQPEDGEPACAGFEQTMLSSTEQWAKEYNQTHQE